MALRQTFSLYEINPYHKPIYALRQALTLCAELLRLKKHLKRWAQSVKWLCAELLGFMKSTQGCISQTHLRSMPSSYALHQTFTPKKVSQKSGA